jgi:EAL domain-containing protein (putative c-di-GMP-specific phosphodiesterase class I)
MEGIRYRRKFLLAVLALGLAIPLIGIVESIIEGDSRNIMVNLAVEAVVLGLLIFSSRAQDKALEAVITFILAAYPISYLWGLTAEGNRQLYVLVLLLMPPVFDNLSPKRWYWFWCFYALTFAATPVIAQLLDIPLAWTKDFSLRVSLTIHLAFLALWVFRYITRRQLLSYTEAFARNIVRDEATGLPTLVVMKNSVAKDVRTAVAILTIGNFRELSTLFGYSIVSELLKSAADRIKIASRAVGGKAFRLRGHDFGLLVPLAPGMGGLELLESLAKDLSGPTVLREKEIELSYRIGYAICQDGQAEKALDQAYEALGMAEREGLDILAFEESVGRATEAEIAVADLITLSRNVSEKTIAVYYQPVKALASGRTAWNEALLRFKISEDRYETPARIMELASTTGHWAAIEDHIFDKAYRRAVEGGGPVSVNIALKDLDRARFRERLALASSEARDLNSAIILEILEGDFGGPNDSRIQALRDLRKAGCLVAIDDFGTGYSNYSRLMNLPVDIVKFDTTLLHGAMRSQAEASLLRSLVRFCYDIGALTVAEGIESRELGDFALSLGFDFGQGYYWSTPMPEEKAEIAERTPLLAGKLIRLDP